METKKQVCRWDMFELELKSETVPQRPVQEVFLQARFQNGAEVKTVYGFYDGGKTWKIRFMPEKAGEYCYETVSNLPSLTGTKGSFLCTEPGPDNHGPVRTEQNAHFSYADGTPFFVMGTTAYVWHYRPAEIRKKTLASFSQFGFNKIRMLFFPKYYTGDYGDVEASYDPPVYPFAGASGSFDFQSPNPEYYRRFEARLIELQRLGIEADVILFHPYDGGKWGIDDGMKEKDDYLYLRYITARLSAFRNVWWSLANEYDLFFLHPNCRSSLKKSIDGWDQIGKAVAEQDPYGHPVSIHNFPYSPIYPKRPWMTHVSYQHPNTYSLLMQLRQEYALPVINDEYQYEGNLRDEWGNSDAETTLFRHLTAVFAGGYATHGEAFVIDGNRKDVFWAYGGTITGESAPRLRFFKKLIMQCDYQRLTPDYTYGDGLNSFVLSDGKGVSLHFYRRCLSGKPIRFAVFDAGAQYRATVYNIWDCSCAGPQIVSADTALPLRDWDLVKIEKLPPSSGRAEQEK